MLEVKVQSDGVKIFDNTGDSADRDVSIWNPNDINGFYRLGHCATNSKPSKMPCE